MAFVLNEKALKVQSWVLGKCVGCLFFFLNHYYQKQSCEFSLSGKVGTTQGEIQLLTLTLS